MHYLLPHSFLLHPNHLVYLSIFALLVIALAAVASILRVFFPKAPYSLLIVSLWSLLLSLCFSADYFRLTPRYFAPLLLIIGTSTLAFSLWQFNRGQSSSSLLLRYKESNSILELLSTICLWILGLFILVIPLAFGFPADTLITSHFICNDSVVHSIMAQGLSYMESRKMVPF